SSAVVLTAFLLITREADGAFGDILAMGIPSRVSCAVRQYRASWISPSFNALRVLHASRIQAITQGADDVQISLDGPVGGRPLGGRRGVRHGTDQAAGDPGFCPDRQDRLGARPQIWSRRSPSAAHGWARPDHLR